MHVPIRKQLETSKNLTESLRWWFIALVKSRKVIFPDQAKRLLKALHPYYTGHFFRTFDTDAVYVYYETGRYGGTSDGVKKYTLDSGRYEFKKKHRANKCSMMLRVMEIEMEQNKGNERERWEQWV